MSNKNRRGTLKPGLPNQKAKKSKVEEKELLGDVEGKSFFKCTYCKEHQGEEAVENKQVDEYAEKEVIGCPICQVQIKEQQRFEIK